MSILTYLDRSSSPNSGVIKNNATVENVKVIGYVVGNNDVAGIVNKLMVRGKVSNVAFIGKLHAGKQRWLSSGVLLARTGKVLLKKPLMLKSLGTKPKLQAVYSSQNGGNNHTVGKEGVLRNSVAKGSIRNQRSGSIGWLNRDQLALDY